MTFAAISISMDIFGFAAGTNEHIAHVRKHGRNNLNMPTGFRSILPGNPSINIAKMSAVKSIGDLDGRFPSFNSGMGGFGCQ